MRLWSEEGEEGIVDQVLQSGAAVYTVYCTSPSRAVRDLAADLFGRVGDAVSKSEREPAGTQTPKWYPATRDEVLRELERRGFEMPPPSHDFFKYQSYLFEPETAGVLGADRLTLAEIARLTGG